jgi:cell division initiation protein
MENDKVMDEVLGDTPEFTVSELYSAEFKTAFRGYDKQRVRGFLARVADAFDALEREVAQLRTDKEALSGQVEEFRQMEKTLVEALAGAQKTGDTAIAQAEREAAVIRSEAEAIKAEATARGTEIPDVLREEITTLRATRTRLKADLRAVLDIHRVLLNDVGADDGNSVEFVPEEGDDVAPVESEGRGESE